MQKVLKTALLVAAVTTGANGHGYVSSPPSRPYGCKTGLNSGCGGVQYEPQSVEGPDGWPAGGPQGGTVAAAGGRFTALNAQSSTRWGKTQMSSGSNTFTWTFTAGHVTRDYKYYITRQGWNQNQALSSASFDTTPFCTVDGGMRRAGSSASHQCNVPTREGYHVVMAVWDVGDTPASFYNAIDLNFGGSAPAPVPNPVPVPPVPAPVPVPPVPAPVPVPNPVPVPPVPQPGCGSGIPKWGACLGKEGCCRSGLTCTGNKWWKSCK
eukprot:TRINITY_DN19_c0_g1_i1.p1 TRINITY_DN19_c0_g1~~TRINITY_DN19_c0_g1_i1.p1  ORF type:complete len:266 (+),score=89.57 TRINITY_DN19_c0_g1_i1:84-881(+)